MILLIAPLIYSKRVWSQIYLLNIMRQLVVKWHYINKNWFDLTSTHSHEMMWKPSCSVPWYCCAQHYFESTFQTCRGGVVDLEWLRKLTYRVFSLLFQTPFAESFLLNSNSKHQKVLFKGIYSRMKSGRWRTSNSKKLRERPYLRCIFILLAYIIVLLLLFGNSTYSSPWAVNFHKPNCSPKWRQKHLQNAQK